MYTFLSKYKDSDGGYTWDFHTKASLTCILRHKAIMSRL